MWIKREVWIPRLLTSNSRVRRLELDKQDSSKEQHNNPSSSSLSSSSKEDQQDGSAALSDDESTEKKRKKMHLKVRRNKMSFSKEPEEPQKKGRRRTTPDNDGDEIEDVPAVIKKHHHGRATHSKTKLVLVEHDEIFDQLKHVLKKEEQTSEQFLSLLAKEFGIRQKNIKQFIKKKNYASVTLEKFLAFLSRYQSTISIVSK